MGPVTKTYGRKTLRLTTVNIDNEDPFDMLFNGNKKIFESSSELEKTGGRSFDEKQPRILHPDNQPSCSSKLMSLDVSYLSDSDDDDGNHLRRPARTFKNKNLRRVEKPRSRKRQLTSFTKNLVHASTNLSHKDQSCMTSSTPLRERRKNLFAYQRNNFSPIKHKHLSTENHWTKNTSQSELSIIDKIHTLSLDDSYAASPKHMETPADQRSCSIRQLDGEESVSDIEIVSRLSKDKESDWSSPQGDSESMKFSSTNKDSNQSGDVSSSSDMFNESEIAKSSEASNATSFIESSTPSEKELCIVPEDHSTTDVEPISELSYIVTNICPSDNSYKKITPVRWKESSLSLENTGSDESELSYESDGELSYDSCRSSRKSSLESSNPISKESLDHLRERLSSKRCQDGVDFGVVRKSRDKTSSPGGWECPGSPRRPAYPISPLGPLPENQEEEAGPSLSTTPSEDDSLSPGPRQFQFKDCGGEAEGRSSGDDSNRNSPVRESARLRRSRRFSKKKENDPRLNMVLEESSSESAEMDYLASLDHIILPAGKKFRKSLGIIKHLSEESKSEARGRNYGEFVETVVKLQGRMGMESPKVGRQSLLQKRKTLLSRMSMTSFKETTFADDPSTHTTGSPCGSKKVFRRKSVSALRESNRLSRLPPEMVLEEEEEDSQDVKEMLETSNTWVLSTSPKEFVFKCCSQTEMYDISNILPLNELSEEARKIGEGVFGEVFLIPRDNAKNVMKIIPIEGELKVNGEVQKTYKGVLNELLISIALTDLRFNETPEISCMTKGFSQLIEAKIVKGKYPDKLIQLWDEFDRTKGSDNDSPRIFPNDQVYLIMELGNAGVDLESYSFSSGGQGLSVFKQTVLALAVAEAYYEFEHRDLHWGNVLVSRTSERRISFILNNKEYSVISNGVKATIIDFTLSRMTCYSLPWFYNVGQDPDMFIGAGDYQFDIYRAMKSDLQDRWDAFVPKTNVRWLHYLVDKLISMVRYQRKTAKIHKDSLRTFKEIESWILSCNSAVEVAQRLCD